MALHRWKVRAMDTIRLIPVELNSKNDGYHFCKMPACIEHPGTRGFCQRHYSKVNRYVAKRLVTWEELENAGMALPKKPPGKPHHDFDPEEAWILSARKDAAA
jgi:hypothetical protein